MADLFSSIKELSAKYFTKMVAVRRHIHRYPELSGCEQATADYICHVLDEFQIPYRKNVAGSGVVAELTGKMACSEPHVVALRADMDALPVQEQTGLPFQSENAGVMHACGHDVHVGCLLGALMILKELQYRFGGTVRAIFQPSEESYEGGAPQMIEAGVLNGVSAIYGLHVTPEIPCGSIGLHAGEFMASTDELHFVAIGKGGHAALVNETVNPLFMAADFICKVRKEVASRNVRDVETVLSFGRLVANGSTNVVPGEAVLAGTLRTFDEAWRDEVLHLLAEAAKEIAAAYNGDFQVDIRNGYPVLKNNPETTREVEVWAKQLLGAGRVLSIPKRMTAEDFSYYLQKMRGTFIRLGSGNESRNTHFPLHSSLFMVDEDCMKTGAALLALCGIA